MSNTQNKLPIVAPGKSVQLPGRQPPVLVTGGNRLPADHGISDAELETMVTCGFLKPFRGDQTSRPLLVAKRAQSPGKWNRNPATLEGLSLDQLNVLIGEVEPDFPAMTTVETAIALLSANYSGKIDALSAHANNGGNAAGMTAPSMVRDDGVRPEEEVIDRDLKAEAPKVDEFDHEDEFDTDNDG